MEMISVSSSSVAAIGYDADTAILRVEYLTGSLYEYIGVPVDIYEGLLYASSVGTYLNLYVKKGGYNYYKIN